MPVPERVTIVVPDDVPSALTGTAAFKRLEDLGEVRLFDTRTDALDELVARMVDASVVVNMRGWTRFTRELLTALPRLRLVTIWGTGTDHIDLAAAAERGVTIMNTPGVAAMSVAEGALGLMLSTARMIPAMDTAVRAGEWPRGVASALHGMPLGILGTGAIGARMAALGRGIGMEVIAWSFHPDEALAREVGFRYTSREAVLREADVVSLHVRLTPRTSGMIGRVELALIKPIALLINTARGACVDEAALAQALETGRLAGAGLDVFATEPVPHDHPLLRAPRVVLMPHSTGNTAEAMRAGLDALAEIVAGFRASRVRMSHVVGGSRS